MYMDRMMSISKATNGFVLEVCVPLKPGAKPSAKTDSCCCLPCGGNSVEKQYIAKDGKEITDLVEDLMPLLDADYKTEDDFDRAFDKATNDIEAGEAA